AWAVRNAFPSGKPGVTSAPSTLSGRHQLTTARVAGRTDATSSGQRSSSVASSALGAAPVVETDVSAAAAAAGTGGSVVAGSGAARSAGRRVGATGREARG